MTSSEFENYLGGWFVRQDNFLDELITARENLGGENGYPDHVDLVARVLSHYQDYFEHKSLLRDNDCFVLFAPPWFTELEVSLMWVAGFKPALVFGLIDDAVPSLTEEQSETLWKLEEETRAEERAVEHLLAKVHEGVAAPKVVTAMRKLGAAERDEEGIAGATEVVMEGIKTSLKRVVAAADGLRMKTGMKVVGILHTVDQKVEFLTAVAILHKKIKLWGLEHRSGSSTSTER